MFRTAAETLLLAVGLALVTLVLSGDARRTAIYLSVASVVLYLATELLRDDE
jgi:hypothetical protein